MPHFQGVCLNASSWRFVNLGIERQIDDLDYRVWEGQPAEFSNWGTFFAPYLQVPSLGGTAFLRNDAWVEASLRGLIMVKRPAWEAITRNWELPQAVGVCHGHLFSRSIRPLLANWFDKKRGSQKAPVYSVAAPVAAILAGAVSGSMGFPLNSLIISGTSQVAEISAVRADINGDSLHVHMEWTCELSQHDSPSAVQSRLNRMVRSLPNLPQSAVWRLDCFSDAPWLLKHLQTLSTASRRVPIQPTPHMHDDKFLARGAACFAALQQAIRLPNVEFTQLQYTDICARDIGLMGDGVGGCYWHTLFPAGTPLPAISSPLRIKGPCPPAFHLFEYLSDGIPSTWQTADEQFLKQVRWYGSGTLSAPRNAQPDRLMIQIQPGSTPDLIPPPQGQLSQS